MVKKEQTRCSWASKVLSIPYHDQEWGVPSHKDDTHLFEFLILEGAQAGLGWDTILQKRENYRAALDGFDARAHRALHQPQESRASCGIPASCATALKIASTVQNAKAFLKVQGEFGSFDKYIWQFVGGKPVVNRWRTGDRVPAKTEQSDAMSKDLKEARLQLRGVDHLLRLHAGGRHGQ
jgi:DNA-3-methyladenine glycosylase I